MVHEGLKGGRGIAESERHNVVLIQAVTSLEGGLSLIALPDSEAVEGVADI